MWPFKKKEKTVATEAVSVPRVSPILEQREGRSIREALKVSINALENDTFFYDWQKQACCNCGIVVQSILDGSRSEVGSLFVEAKADLGYAPSSKGNSTWREVAQQSCSVTGMPLKSVFLLLSKHGFYPKDVVHLEYMNNRAILSVSGINTNEDSYHTKRLNLVKYLKAWLKILDGEADTNLLSDRGVLEAKLLVATANEDYEVAAALRDQIVSL